MTVLGYPSNPYFFLIFQLTERCPALRWPKTLSLSYFLFLSVAIQQRIPRRLLTGTVKYLTSSGSSKEPVGFLFFLWERLAYI